MYLIEKYFPNLTTFQKDQLSRLHDLYLFWNERINLISRKDIEHLYERHILHSLSIAKVFQFNEGTSIADVGTGGGLPGIPLSIIFPHVHFTLVDSIGKKIKVVNNLCESLSLDNVEPINVRFESMNKKFNFIVCRAVSALPEFVNLVKKNLLSIDNHNEVKNGIIYLKGGDLTQELDNMKNNAIIYPINSFFKEPFFQTKKIIYLSF